MLDFRTGPSGGRIRSIRLAPSPCTPAPCNTALFSVMDHTTNVWWETVTNDLGMTCVTRVTQNVNL